MDKITVEIQDSQIIDMPACSVEPYIISELKRIGIPVIGTLCFKGIKNGVLKKREDYQNHSIVYTWIDK